MPGKRTRKDSERSTGSSGIPSTSGVGNETTGNGGAGSCSSGSIADDSEHTDLKACCFPSGCPFGEEALSDENAMVKVVCSFDDCPTSQFMHTECFNHWEENLLNFLRSHGRARSWSEKQRRQNLWTKKGYDLVFRACACKCKHGHLKKDLNWAPQFTPTDSTNKKKNRKKHKDLPTLGGYSGIIKSKSKPIPNGKDSRIRHSSASSIVSVDQGYISASPGTAEMGPSVFSPPTHPHHYRPFFSFHNSTSISGRGSSSFHAPSTSPLPEIPDDSVLSNLHFDSSRTSTDTSPVSPPTTDIFSSPFSPEAENKPPANDALPLPSSSNRIEFAGSNDELHAMSAYIESVLQRNKQEANSPAVSGNYAAALRREIPSRTRHQSLNQMMQFEQAMNRMQLNPGACPSSYPPRGMIGNNVDFGRRDALGSSWLDANRVNDIAPVPGTNAQVLMALRQKEQNEMQKQELKKFFMNVRSQDENKAQLFTNPPTRSRHNSHTEMRLVPMRSTNFAKRYDFSSFQRVLASQLINPYHIKMEGEGYGSDDLRNFILSSLSKERCSQMNCVVCGVDLPVYDHFPLIDGSMFLSPEKNERSTKNCFKIKVEGKCEYVHAACIRCIEGLHNIVCRLCNSRWEGTHHQLGTLYMFDIFAASPCCQKRLCCKQCGGVIVDIRQGLNYFSEYSTQKPCPHCHAVDHHFVHPVTTYQLMGLVYS